MDIFPVVPDDPTRVTAVGISLFGSAYSSYALHMIRIKPRDILFATHNGICVSFPLRMRPT